MNIYVTLHFLLLLVHYAVSDHEYDIKTVENGVEYWCKTDDTEKNDVDEESSEEDVKGALHKFACDGEYLTIDCGQYRTIKVLKANYGRKDINTCSKSEKLSLTSCYSRDTINVVRRRCENKSMCKLKTDISVFGEPCRFVEKYLEVMYTCELAEFAVACEGVEITMKCNEEKHLNIANAIYEKHALCTGNVFIDDHQCTSTDSLEKVQESCQHRARCKINNDGHDLGEPCPLKMRQLKIKYSCQDWKTQDDTKTVKKDEDDIVPIAPPELIKVWATSVTFKIDSTKFVRGEQYQLQYKESDEPSYKIIDLKDTLDLSKSLSFSGVWPAKTYDMRVVLKRMPPSKCSPFVRFSTMSLGL